MWQDRQAGIRFSSIITMNLKTLIVRHRMGLQNAHECFGFSIMIISTSTFLEMGNSKCGNTYQQYTVLGNTTVLRINHMWCEDLSMSKVN